MGPPEGVVFAIGLWLVVVALALSMGVRFLTRPADSARRRGVAGTLLLLTAGLPVLALVR